MVGVIIYSGKKNLHNLKICLHGLIHLMLHKTCYEVVAEDGVYLCELTGNMIYGRMPDEYLHGRL